MENPILITRQRTFHHGPCSKCNYISALYDGMCTEDFLATYWPKWKEEFDQILDEAKVTRYHEARVRDLDKRHYKSRAVINLRF